MKNVLLIGPVIGTIGIILASIGIGLFDYRAGMIAGGLALCGLATILPEILVRIEERKKNESSRQVATRST